MGGAEGMKVGAEGASLTDGGNAEAPGRVDMASLRRYAASPSSANGRSLGGINVASKAGSLVRQD